MQLLSGSSKESVLTSFRLQLLNSFEIRLWSDKKLCGSASGIWTTNFLVLSGRISGQVERDLTRLVHSNRIWGTSPKTSRGKPSGGSSKTARMKRNLSWVVLRCRSWRFHFPLIGFVHVFRRPPKWSASGAKHRVHCRTHCELWTNVMPISVAVKWRTYPCEQTRFFPWCSERLSRLERRKKFNLWNVKCEPRHLHAGRS